MLSGELLLVGSAGTWNLNPSTRTEGCFSQIQDGFSTAVMDGFAGCEGRGRHCRYAAQGEISNRA